MARTRTSIGENDADACKLEILEEMGKINIR